MNKTLPEGYRITRMLPEHEQGVVDVMNCFYQWMNGDFFTTLESMQAEWADPIFNREEDIQVVLGPDNKVVAYVDMYDFSSLHVCIFSWPAIHPEQMGMGIEDALLEWAVNRSRQRVPLAPEEARIVMQVGANADNQMLYDLYTRHGFQPVRYSYRMRIDFEGPLPTPTAPEGIVIRPMQVGKEEREVIFANYDSFRDHWGTVDEPFDSYLQQWMHHMETDPNYDPAFYFVALDGKEVAGVALCYPQTDDAPEMGWVESLGVRRAWRKRGLGLALLQHAFYALQQCGRNSVGLGVDVQSLTGALRLYEKAGMRVWRKNCTYEYELRPGKDLMKQKLEE